MNTKEILLQENNNHDSIFLLKEGCFWRAYERSAFRFVKNIRSFQIIKKYVKCVGQNVVCVGLPLDNLDQILETADEKGFDITKKDDRIEIRSFTDLEDFDSWKGSLSAARKANPEFIFEKIRKFPIANRTPLEALGFIMELKEDVGGQI